MPKGKKVRRAVTYTEAIAEEILARLAAGETLTQICRDDHIPSRSAVSGWVVKDTNGFKARYETARRMQVEAMADEIIDIADDASNDWMDRETEKGRIVRVIDKECVQRSRVRVDTRKFLMAKLMPERFGDRQSVEVTGKDGKDLIPQRSDEERMMNLAHSIAFTLAYAERKKDDKSNVIDIQPETESQS